MSTEPPLTLAPLTAIDRPMSVPEYYHAAIGSSPKTLEPPRDAIVCFEGEVGANGLDPDAWRAALAQVAAVQPGLRLRLYGKRRGTHWRSDGPPPVFRYIPDCQWDGNSGVGLDFLGPSPLSLEHGPSLELILAAQPQGRALLILRSPHAIVDGGGILHFFRELFRARRGEPLLGSNAAFSDVQLMRSLNVRHSTSRHLPAIGLTGAPQGEEKGDDWRRLRLAPGPNQLARLAVALAEFAHQHGDGTALIAIPCDLRRHMPGLLATSNFAAMLLVPLERGDGTEVFKARLKTMLDGRMEAHFPKILDVVRWLPMPWLDRLLSRTERNYRTRKPVETAVISKLGPLAPAEFSCSDFAADGMLAVPLAGSSFAALMQVGDRINMVINLPRVWSSNGRFDALVAHLLQRLA